MSEKFSPRSSAGNNSSSPPQTFSLSDLLPDLIENPPATPRPPASPVAPPYQSGEGPVDELRAALSLPEESDEEEKPGGDKRSGGLRVIALAVGAMVAIPLLAVGVFFFLVNLAAQPPSAEQVQSAALTPLPTVAGITPRAGPPQSPAAGRPPVTTAPATAPVSNCPNNNPPGTLEAFPCARTLNADKPWKDFFAPAEAQYGKDGHTLNGTARYDSSTETPERIVEWYTNLLRGKGFNPGALPGSSQGNGTIGSTPLGPYRVAYFNNSRQQIQLFVLSLNKDGPAGSAKKAETVIRLSAG